MNQEPENSNSDQDSQAHSENSSSEDTPPHKQDSSFDAEEYAEPESEKSNDENCATKKTSYSKKGWLLLPFLIITIVAGGYFYTQKNGINLSMPLSLNLNKPFSFATKETASLTTQSETKTIKPALKINKQVEKSRALKKPTIENEITINLLRDEIQSLKKELTKKNSTPPQNVQSVTPHISGRITHKKTKDLISEKGDESGSEMQVALIPPLPVQAEPNVNTGNSVEETEPQPEMAVAVISPPLVNTEITFQPNKHQKVTPQRSKEVQAYLDFIENTGSKLLRLIKNGWARMQALILEYENNI